jgi:DNA invertase Pin-like site-specific DNA recombinase
MTTAPAFGYSIVANLGGDRQMTVQCFVAEDEADAEVHAKIDRAFRVVDRQKARYELVDLREELHKVSETLAQFREDKARIDHQIDVKLAQLDVQAATANDDYKERMNEGAAKHAARGRVGDYQPTGAERANLDRITASVAQIAAEKAKIEAERTQHAESVMISIKRHEEACATLSAKIAEREALLA